jgi:hypothetical protein
LVVFCFTKPMMVLIGRSKFFNSGKAITGVSRKSMGLLDLQTSAQEGGA